MAEKYYCSRCQCATSHERISERNDGHGNTIVVYRCKSCGTHFSKKFSSFDNHVHLTRP